MARTTTYTPELGQFIAELVAGGLPLYKIGDGWGKIIDEEGILGEAGQLATFPIYSTITRWMIKYPEFDKMIGEARVVFADRMAEEVVEIADEEPVTTDMGAIDPAWVNNQRNRIEARKWAAGVRDRRKFGSHTTVGGDAENPLRMVTEIVVQRIGGPEGPKLNGMGVPIEIPAEEVKQIEEKTKEVI